MSNGTTSSSTGTSRTEAIFAGFLERQASQARALAGASDIVSVNILDPQHFLVLLDCCGLVRTEDGAIREHRGFAIGVFLHDGYLAKPIPAVVLCCMFPRNTFHPNIRGAAMCVGRIAPATPVVDLIHRVYELVTYQAYTTLEYDCLQRDACSWARRNGDRLPIDCRPLRHSRLLQGELRE